MKATRLLIVAVVALLFTLTVGAATVDAGRPGIGNLYHDGEVVRTLVPPAAAPHEGVDPLYPIEGGVEGQLPVAGAGPGDTDYHGGQWAVSVVTWNTYPYLLTSEADVLAAAAAGDVTITRVSEADFKCPIQP